MTPVRAVSTSDVLVYTSAATLLYVIAKRLVSGSSKKTNPTQSSSLPTTPLRGPPSTSFLYGASQFENTPEVQEEPSAVYDEWIDKYGTVIHVPTALGGSKIVILDPRAANHFYTGETWLYQRHKIGSKFVEQLFGRGLLWAEAHAHKRQRKALTPAFSTAAIRHLTTVFYDAAHKAKIAWDHIIETSGSDDEAVIEVQNWMNRISLDSIGIAGFSHDFDTLSGSQSTVLDIFNDLGSPASQQSKFGILVFMASFVFPALLNVPTTYNKMLSSLKTIMSGIADVLLAGTRNEKSAVINETRAEEKSIIGLLIQAENQDAELKMSEEEVLAQMNTLMFAGYETTSASITWALIELCKHEDVQKRLREELVDFGSGDPTYDQLMNGLPFLDAVVHETLRLHPPIPETIRVATEQDIIPLSKPYTTATGQLVDSIVVKKGETVSVPLRWLNRASEFWGEDGREFNPDRWLDEKREGTRGAKEVNGHRKLLTFSDGARICLGKQFALAEFKAVLTTMVKSYEFRFRDGKDTKIGTHPSLLPRAKIAGEEGMSVPLLVRRLH